MSAPVDTVLSYRALSLLRAVRVGRAVLVCGCVPHLLVDGLHVCDMDTHALAGLIAPAIPGQVGMRVLARLTDAGQRVLDGVRLTATNPDSVVLDELARRSLTHECDSQTITTAGEALLEEWSQ